ncbi:MAG: DUF2341 domain-containing protein [Gammaproteobacteria bacterium]
MAKKDDKDKKYKPRPELEAVEPRLLFSAGLEGVLAATQLETPPDDYPQTVIEQTLDQGSLQTTEASSADVRLELVFVDTDVPEYQTLLSDLLTYPDEGTRYEVFELDNTQDGLAQISAVLSGFDNINAVHILSHGEAGAIDLGGTMLDGETLATNVDLVQSWGSALTDSADIMIYGCNLAANEAGQALIDSLAELTGADVAASDDLTGNAEVGGDWELEYTTGTVETNIAVNAELQNAYQQTLATYTVTTLADSGAGSLRQAITDANASGGADTIEFTVTGSITLVTGLPAISQPVNIDATTAPGYVGEPLVILDGSAVTGNGLTFQSGADGSSVQGLAIVDFTGNGIQINSGADGISITGNWIGTTGNGSIGVGNSNNGINVQGANTIIGGTGANDGNVITNNGNEGINVTGTGATGTVIQGNIIGLDPDGSTGSGNGDVGIALLSGADNTTIGGTTVEARNIISNNYEGIEINSSNNIVQGNYIGTDITGTLDRGNRSDDGIEIQNNATGNLIGGTTPGAGNLIAFNALDGINIVNGSGNAVLGNEIYSNGDQDIDIGVGANSSQSAPSLSFASVTENQITVSGILSAAVNDYFRVEFFAESGGVQAYIGFANVTTDGAGNATINATLDASIAVGATIKATATDSDAGYTAFTNSSELSAGVVANAGNDAPAVTAWFNDAWDSRKALTIGAASVAGDLTNFPLLITLNTDAELAAQALANGDDILFTAADGVTQLAHEIEHFDEATGELRVWVKTDLSASVDTNIFMYFGNAASGNQENIPAVWDNYVGVYHLNESPTGAPGELIDSSGSGNHATTEGSMDAADSVSTTIGQGLVFDGTDDMIRITDSATLDSVNDEATFSLWINFVDSADGDHQIIMSSSNRYSGLDGYEWAQQGDGDHFFYPDAMLPDTNYNLGLDPFTNDTWHHLAATMDFATKEVKVYVDGSPMTFTYEGVPGSWTTLTSSDDMLWGGNPDRATRYFLGMMDEIRIADVARSQEWIQTEYNNQSAPGAFFSVGVTEAKRDSLTDINEDDFNAAGDSVLSIINSSGADRIMDSDAGALEGIAVTAVDDTNGQWQYDANADGTWVAFGAVSDTSAVLLDTGALVRFVPDADYNGSAGDLTFHAWDQTSGANGATGIDVSINGGSTAFSAKTFAATLNIIAVNDDPVITSDGGGATANINVAENTLAVTTVTSSDVDLDTPSYSISGGADAAQFTINSGTGALSFVSAPDFENPTDAGADNVYTVTVQVSDGNGGIDAQSITINVIDMADGIRVTPISIVPIGNETLVNTTTTDNQQIGAGVHQGMATDANGNYIVVWASNLQDGSGWGIYVQRYSADETAVGGEFLVTTTTADSQLNPSVAMDAAGNFIVTWQSNLQDGDSYGVYAQRFDAVGVAQGGEFLVNTTTAGYQGSPTIAMDTDGGFVIAWVANGQDPDASLGIYAQRYDASGTAQGGEFRVNTYTTGTQQVTSIGMDAAGNFVVIWASENQDGSNYGIFGQRFDAGGNALGSEFRVNTTTANSQYYHDVVMLDDGRFVVEYQSRNADGSFEVFMQRYAADGSTVGGEIRVNTTTVSSAQQPIGSITADASGNITVVWNSDADGDGTAVVGQRLDWAGNKLGGEFIINTTTSGNQTFPEVIAQAGGGFIVAWGGSGAGDADGVFMQRYGLAVSEEGASATFQIVLESAPTADVTIPISVSDPTEGMVSVGSVTFTTGNWSTPQTVTINGVQDFTIDGDQAFQVILGAATSADPNFSGLDLADLTVINTELPNQAPTGLPAITGTVEEDQVLTADTSGISDPDGLGAFSYQWYRDGVLIAGATASTYTLGDADVGAQISVAVSYTDGRGSSEGPLVSAQTGSVANINDAPTGSVTISGTPTEDQMLTASHTLADADGLGVISYQWYRDGVAIAGATGTTYTLGDADVGTTITVRASYTDGYGQNESVSSAGVGPVANVNDAPTGSVTIDNTTPAEGDLLTASNTLADADGLSGPISYQWYRDGVAIGGATGSTYTTVQADVGTVITVVASYTDDQGTAESVSSAGTAAVTNVNNAPTGSVTISGTPTEDQVLTASNTLADVDGMGPVSYQWYRDGVAIGGATGTTYTLGDLDVGATITVTTSYTDGQGTNESVTSVGVGPIANVNDLPVGVPTITGTVQEDQVLTADTSGISDADGLGAFAYQWLRDGVAIGGATGATYTLGDTDVGAQISVQVSYTDGQGTSEGPLTSAQTAAVTNMNDTPVGVPTITGTVQEDQVLTADTSGISDADGLGAFSYQWLRDGVAIGGATGNSYTLGDADVGAQISVQVSYTDLNGTSESVTSAQTAAVTNINDAPTGSVTIDNTTPAEGDTLTASNTLADVDGLSGPVSYQWYRDGVAIGGATGSTYTTVQADVGAVIAVVASYTDDQSTAESVSSAGTAAVINVNDAPTGTVSISGTPAEDQVLTASNTLADVDGLGAISYQWYRDGVAIAGATGSTHTLGDVDVGTTITVAASYTDGQGTNESVTSAGVGPVANINDAPVGVPTIAGTVTEDQTLTADTSGISDADGLGALSYQWLRDGLVIAGATSATYTLGDADVGATISVETSYTDGQGASEAVTSAGVGPVVNVNDAPAGLPVITGTPVEDRILTVDTTGITDADGISGAFSYQWYRDGVAIAGANGGGYILGDADVGTIITASVSYVDDQGASESVSSAGVGPIANVNDVPSGSVLIDNMTPAEGDTLTASNSLTDADGLSGAISYQWYRDGIAIGGATASTYTSVQADVGAIISVVANYTDDQGASESVSSANTAVVTNVNNAPTGSVTIDNIAPAEGDTLTASNTLADVDGLNGPIGYQWYRDGVAIGGATGSTYTTVQADVGAVITVVAGYTDDQGTAESMSSAGTAAVTNVNNAPTGAVGISGTPAEDQTLTASNTLADVDGMGPVSYQWYRDGVAIAGATGSAYTLGDADVGATITVTASYTDGQGMNETMTSAGAGPVVNVNDAPTGSVTIDNPAPAEGDMLTASNTLADADGLSGAISYQWYRDGVAIAGAAGANYTTVQGDVGSVITVVASYTDDQGTAESVSSTGTAAVTNVNNAPTGSVNISGTPAEDQTLTASNTLADVDGIGVIGYQWYRDGVAIVGATGSIYTLGDADVGAMITVAASYTDGQGTSENVTSAGVGPVANVNDLPSGLPAITGLAQEDQVLTVDTSTIGDADGLGAFNYQWLRDGSAITGATGSTYALDDADVGSQISVTAIYIDANGTAESLTSMQTTPVANVNDIPTGAVTIDNLMPGEGDAISVSHTLADADGISGPISYQWYRDGIAIAGATGTTYVTTQADVGTVITVEANYIDDQGFAESESSVGALVAGVFADPGEDTTDETVVAQTEPPVVLRDSVGATPAGSEEQSGVMKEIIASHEVAEEGDTDYRVDPYQYLDDADLELDEARKDNVIKHAVRSIVQAGYQITEEMLQLFDLTRIKLSEVDDQPASGLVKSVGGLALSVSAGVVSWVLRGGALAASMLSSVSVLKGFDPLPVMDMNRKKGNRPGHEDDADSDLDNMFDEADLEEKGEASKTAGKADK